MSKWNRNQKIAVWAIIIPTVISIFIRIGNQKANHVEQKATGNNNFQATTRGDNSPIIKEQNLYLDSNLSSANFTFET